jgi:MarR-like DNA-binding transcriptional regulator SgrR of sgrS sRNA
VLVALLDQPTTDQLVAKVHGNVAKLIVPIFQFDPPDPPLNSNPFFLQLERATCAGLVRMSSATGEVEPDLAAAMPTVSPDRLTYTFHVRRGLRFAPPSGAPVTAGAVRYSIERALSPKLGTPRPAADYLGDVSAIGVRGSSISFKLRAPSPDFLERLSLPYYCTVPPQTPIVDGGLQPIAPPSAAPYYIAQRSNGDWTVLRRNPYYRGPHPAQLGAIVLREGLDPERAVSKVEHGAWQGLELDDPALHQGSVVATRAKTTAGTSYRVVPELTVQYLALNSRRGPLRDVALRRRIAAALDRAALAAATDETATANLLPPALRGGTNSPAPRRHVKREARPVTLALAVDSHCDEPCAPLPGAISDTLRSLGIQVRFVAVPDVERAMRARAARIDLAPLTTTLPYPDAASFLSRMLGHDVPKAWLRPTVRRAVAKLNGLSRSARERAAVTLARRLERVGVPVVAYGTPQIGVLLRRELGCRRWDRVDAELDLNALCLIR